jgi:hypothetical protein
MDRVLRISGQNGDEILRGWRELHNKEFHNLSSSANINRMIKSRRIKWTVHVARTGRRRMNIGFWRVSQNERDH